MSFTDIFVRRPVLASVVSLLILLVGVRSVLSLEVRQFPETKDTVITIDSYTGISICPDDADEVGELIQLASSASVEAEEQELRLTFENKQRKAVNYDAYKDQLSQIEQSFGTMLRQLPGETEIPSLIVDISQTGLASGLQEKLFQPQPEVPKDFYAEKPIKIQLSGGYHEIANFVSGVAALPRIVTLHNINITHENQDAFDELTMEVTAQTYRYLEEAQ